MRTYIARSGVKQYQPSLKEVMAMGALEEGLCLSCGKYQAGVESDMRKGKCESCGAHKVYGGEELALMGLTY